MLYQLSYAREATSLAVAGALATGSLSLCHGPVAMVTRDTGLTF